MNTYYRVMCLLVACIGLFGVATVSARETDCDEIADWYPTLDPKDELAVAYAVAIGGKTEKERISAKAFYDDKVNEMLAADIPTCLVIPYFGYIEGLLTVSTAIKEFWDGNIGQFTIKLADGMQNIGEFRGFLKAIGVKVKYDPDASFYFR